MDWAAPLVLALALLLLPLLAVWQRGTVHPMSPWRRRALLVVRAALVVLILLAIASPAWEQTTEEQAVIFVMDHSRSQGLSGMTFACERAESLAAGLPAGTRVGVISAGASTVVRRLPTTERSAIPPEEGLLESDGAQTDLAAAVALARGLFPAGTARRIVLLPDGMQTRGALEEAAREAELAGSRIDAVPVPGEARPDVRVIRLRCSRSRLHEGATLELTAAVESSLEGEGVIRLFENGVDVEQRRVKLAVGQTLTETFRRTPETRNLYNYRVRLEGFAGDTIPENNEAMALVDVRGRPMLLYIEGEPNEAHYLADAMAREGLRLHVRPPHAIPESLQDLAGYDGIIISDVPAHKLTERAMTLIRDYVEQLGGGFLMIGGPNSFGVGGYYRTPIEEILPVKMKAPDVEERASRALVLVLDRSGSMSGQKIEICKSAAVATAELLTSKDYIGVVAFDSSASWVVPMTRLTSRSAVARQISSLNAGGGTNIYPGMIAGREGLASVRAKVKHMIVLSDGQTQGAGYQALAAQMTAEGVTISTIAVGSGAAFGLLQSIAAAGGGQAYQSADPRAIPRIFTRDTMVHMGRLIREEPFKPKQVERHPMLAGWAGESVPELLGYVKAVRRETAQVPLVTDIGDPLLAHWRFGLGKVTAFTSDCKSRWSALWVADWPGYSPFWAQVLRETAREPQGQSMDLHLEESAKGARIVVDLMEDAAQFRNEAVVEANVYFVPARSLSSSMRPLEHLVLEQEGPGRYTGRFRPEEPGVYLVRARSGADLVSAGIVHNVSGEAAAGRMDLRLLERVCEATGGKLLTSPGERLPIEHEGHSMFVELRPLLLKLLLVLFMLDGARRRWENVLGMVETARGKR